MYVVESVYFSVKKENMCVGLKKDDVNYLLYIYNIFEKRV